MMMHLAENTCVFGNYTKLADLAFLYYFVVKSKKNQQKVYFKWELNYQPQDCGTSFAYTLMP